MFMLYIHSYAFKTSFIIFEKKKQKQLMDDVSNA